MKPHTAIACLALALPALCHAIAPAAAGRLALPAPVLQMHAAADAPRAAVLLKADGDRPSGLQMIDLAQPQAPVLRGFLALAPLAAAGEFSITPDGRRALVLLQPEPLRFGEATRQVVVAVDLTEAAAPRELWRHELRARRVLLATGGGAIVASQPAGDKPGAWETRVEWPGTQRAPLVIAEDDGPPEQVSADGRALYREYGPLSDRRECTVAVLDSGHVLVEDMRAPRMSLYGPGAEPVRVAVLPHDGTRHCNAIGLDAAGNLLLAGQHGVVRQVGLAKPANALVNGEWQLPPGLTPLAARGPHLYAAGTGELRVFRMDLGNASDVDWAALEKAHAAAMAKYTQALLAGKPDPSGTALAELEAAGAAMAPDSPLLGIAPRSAAAILDDFGWLLRRDPRRYALAEFALRRAHVLDPDRPTATLRLADLWRDHLPAMVDLPQRERRRLEIEALYRQYLALGGRPTLLARAYAMGDPARDATDLCEAIARYTNAGRLGDLVARRAVGVALEQRLVDMRFSTEGTARVPVVQAWSQQDDAALDTSAIPEPAGEELSGGDQLALLAYKGNAQILHLRDLQHPVATVPLAGGTACHFNTTTVEKASPRAAEPALCRRLIAGQAPKAVDFQTPAPIGEEKVRARHPESTAQGMARIDLTNDGRVSTLALMQLSSGAGAGCEAQFFDLLDATGRQLATGRPQALLATLQGLDTQGRYSMPCGNEVRLFRHAGKTYFESRPAGWPPQDNADQYHRVARIDQGVARDVCGFSFESTVSVAR